MSFFIKHSRFNSAAWKALMSSHGNFGDPAEGKQSKRTVKLTFSIKKRYAAESTPTAGWCYTEAVCEKVAGILDWPKVLER